MLTRFRFLPKSLDWLLVLALALIDIVLLCIGPMRLVWRPEVLILLAALALAGLGWGCRRYYRRLPHLAHMVLIPGQAARPFRDDGAPLFRSIVAQHSD